MYKIIITEFFKKQLKRLVKKNRLLKEELKTVLVNFDKKYAISIGNNVYKTRIAGQNKGKSGGYRMYVFIMEIENILTPICIYSKNEKENLGIQDLNKNLESTIDELKKHL